ncbi:unnamed protein product [Bemisia tabaci]|uniref:Uncharacterized protein n=1 Tax=Bemisia tabaci TaxID=7038 RepID=A0A9P0A570_BEMTA|nr:unnamed protein product [Bemisia tabaci]
MGLPAVSKKQVKKEKKLGVLNGKIEKKGKEKGSITKGIEEVKNKFNQDKKKQIKQEPGSPNAAPSKQPKFAKSIKQEPGSPNKKVKTEAAGVPNSNNTNGTSVSKFEKKKNFKVNKAKNANKNSEAVTKVSASPNAGKKTRRGKKKGSKAETPVNGSPAVKGPQKPKEPLTKEQEEKILQRRKEKIEAWQNTIDLILSQKKIPKDEADLIRRSKKYDKLPLWKKNYVTWVKTEPMYKNEKFGPLIKKVYKVLKGAERKAARTKKKTKQSVPEQPQLKAAIERCVQLTSEGTDVSATKPVGKKNAAKQKKISQEDSKQDIKKLTESIGKKKKGKPQGKKKQ